MTTQSLSTVLCAGETMALVTPRSVERLRSAEAFHLDVGGAESNVAAHLAALGRPARWFSRLGDDELGRRVADQVSARGVILDDVVFDPLRATGVYFKDPGHGVLYYRAGSAASALCGKDAEDIRLEGVGLVHLSGITPALSPTAVEFVDVLMTRSARAGLPVSFDVNHRPLLWQEGAAPGVLKSFAERADILLVGLDEAERLWNTSTAQDVRDVFPHVPVLVVKDGAIGASEFTAQGYFFQPAIPTDVVEIVGAGDAFAAGYLDRYLAGAAPADRLRAGHQRASLTLQTTKDFTSEGATP
ncbi:sugar kinase [Nesterenkonia sphaerica]|nr:sugar kinase [Nesterenkonia sphaerica]